MGLGIGLGLNFARGGPAASDRTPGPAYSPLLLATFFQQPDSATVVPAPEVGPAWTQHSGGGDAMGTKGYRLYASAAVVNPFLTSDIGAGDFNVEMTLFGTGGGNTTGFYFAWTDANNCYFVRAYTSIDCYVRLAGAQTQLLNVAQATTEGDVLRIEKHGNLLRVKLNGSQVGGDIDITAYAALTGTKLGPKIDNTVSLGKYCVADGNPAAAAGNAVRCTNIRHNQIVQSRWTTDDKADITISGTYAGTATKVQARAVWSDPANWYDIDAAPVGGNFSGVLKNVAVGQGLLEVRLSNDQNCVWRMWDVGVGDVFGCAGQSNPNRGANHQYFSHATLRAGTHDKNGGNGYGWRPAFDSCGFENPANGTTTPLLATKIMAAQNRPVGFIDGHIGATGLTNNGGAQWRGVGGSAFDAFVTQVLAAAPNGIRAVIWWQGENDAESPSSGNYEADLKSLRGWFQTAFGFAVVPSFIAVQLVSLNDGSANGSRTKSDDVRLGISHAWDTDATILSGGCMYDIDTTQSGGGGQHIRTDADMLTAATRIWRMIKFHLYGGVEGRSYKFASATKTAADTVRVVFAGGTGGLSASPSTVGWLVTDTVTDRTVTSVTKIDAVTVDVKISVAMVGATVISFGSYFDGIGANLTDSGAICAAPVEPFSLKAVSGS